MPVRTLAGHAVNLREAGTGPLVICLHCSSSHSGQWKPLMAALSPRFRVIAPDILGYGRSGPLPRDGLSCFAHDVAVLSALLEAEGPAHLVGHSLGGVIALSTALREDRVRSVLAIEPVLFNLLVEAGHPEAGDDLAVAEAIGHALAAGHRETAARDFVDFWSGPGAWEAMDPGTQDYVRATIDRVAADFDGIRRDAVRPGLADLAALNMPVRLIRGSATRPAAHAIVALAAEARPGTPIVEIPEADHMAAAFRPDLLNPQIIAHLAEVAL